MKKILLISPFYKPDPIGSGKYNGALVDSLLASGHNVDVWCFYPLYPNWKVRKFSDHSELEAVSRGGSSILFPRNAYLRRAVLEITFFLSTLKKILFTKSRYDTLVLVFPPSLFALALPFFGKRNRAIVGIVHDLQGVFIPKNGGLIYQFVARLICKVENRAFRNCDKLVFLSKEMLNLAKATYSLNLVQCTVQYPFVTIKPYDGSVKLSKTLPKSRINVVYSGALGQKQCPDLLIKLMTVFARLHEDILCHIFSEGPIFEEIKAQHESATLNFHNLVEPQDLAELLHRSNIQIIPQALNTSHGSLPSKLPNILASGTAIFAVTDSNSELQFLLSRFSGTCVVTTWEIEQIVDTIQNFLSEIDPSQKYDRDTSEFSINSLKNKLLD